MGVLGIMGDTVPFDICLFVCLLLFYRRLDFILRVADFFVAVLSSEKTGWSRRRTASAHCKQFQEIKQTLKYHHSNQMNIY